MKVLFVNENIGGHATVHATLRRSLDAHPEVEAEFLDVPKATGLRRAVGSALPGLGRLDLDFQALRAQLALSQWVRRQLDARARDFDVVHVYTGHAALRSVEILRSMPSVVATDATAETNAHRLPYRPATRHTHHAVAAGQRFEGPAMRAATLVVANTHWVGDSIRRSYGVGDDRLRVFPYGVAAPAGLDGPAPGTADVPGRLPRLVFVGRQLDRKGALRLQRLHQAHLADECELVIVSPEEPPPGRNVRHVGDVTVGDGRLWEELRAAAVFVFPSTIDQAPNAVIEAAAAGLPVVGLRIAAMPEMVPASCGTLVEPGDDAGLVAALRDLVRDPALRVRQGTAARAHFLERYDAAACTRRLVETLQEARTLFAATGPRR